MEFFQVLAPGWSPRGLLKQPEGKERMNAKSCCDHRWVHSHDNLNYEVNYRRCYYRHYYYRPAYVSPYHQRYYHRGYHCLHEEVED